MIGVQLQWMQRRLELKPDLVHLLSKTDYDCYDTFIDLENDADILKLLDEAKETPDEWPSVFNATQTNFNPGTLRKLSKIPTVAKKLGEPFFSSMKRFELEPTEEIDDPLTSTIEIINNKIEEFEDDNCHTLNPSEIDANSFLLRLKSSIERVYSRVMHDMTINVEEIEATIEFTEDNIMLPTHNCLICQKSLKISYQTKHGKLKQFFTGNMKKHLVKMHTGGKDSST